MRKPSLYKRLRQILSDFLFVLFHWREYHDVVLTLHQPWFDVVEGSDLLYLSDPANWRCKFCGCEYSCYTDYDRLYLDEEINQQRHSDGCLWLRIKEIHPYYR